MHSKQMGDLLRQAARLRKEADKARESLRKRYVEGVAGGDLVRCTFNGLGELMKVEISPKALEGGADGKVDRELLEDLVSAAVRQGLEKARKLEEDVMEKATGGLSSSMPGLF